MKKLSVLLAILVVAGGTTALAQTSKKNTGMGAGDSSSRPAAEAPVGHRQPRPNDLPNEKNVSDPTDPLNRENLALDRKIKSICRGC